ncbi:MAG: arsenate reductase (glutaredoxin) [Gammaproteobacteria bacterium]|jgi:arsenate reductase
MTAEITIYHNPRCSKSRAALELLRRQGIEPAIIEYLKEPPSQGELAGILDMLGMDPRDLMRRKESEYREQGLDDPGLGRTALIQAMHDTPKLIERPIVVAGDRAALGRPPEKVLEIIK